MSTKGKPTKGDMRRALKKERRLLQWAATHPPEPPEPRREPTADERRIKAGIEAAYSGMAGAAGRLNYLIAEAKSKGIEIPPHLYR